MTPDAHDTLNRLRLAPFHLDDAAVAWVASTLRGLGTEARLRQLLNVASASEQPDDIAALARRQVGAVTRFGGADAQQAWRATRTLIEASEIPLLISGDIEGGAIAMRCGTALPNQLGLAATGSTALAAEAVEVLAAEARLLGYNWSFTPVIDINAAFRSAIVATRSYGSSLQTIAEHALVNVATFQRHGIAATAKHWPGEGCDDRDQHLVTTLNPLDEAAWHASFGSLYRRLIEAGVMSVMSAHIAWPAYARRHGLTGLETCRPASVSSLLNERLLRGELGFGGLIVSDATGMAGLTAWADRSTFVPEVIANGCDMLLFPHDVDDAVQSLLQALRDGRLSEARVEDAATRVLGLKAALGLHRRRPDELLPPWHGVQQGLRQPRHLAVADKLARHSVTLVKDVQQTLPLSPARHRRIVVVTDPQRKGFVGETPASLLLPELLAARGFDVRCYDAESPPTRDNADLVLYLLAQESLLTVSNIFIDWSRLHGTFRMTMQRFWHELPCVLVSFGHPYYLYDAPRMPCLINAYSAIEPVQRAVLRQLLGELPFVGGHPVDASCGLPDAMY